MRCPFCSAVEDKVIDSRSAKDLTFIRRRRECLHCGRRFTTYERIEEVMPAVVKKNGDREIFDRNKIRRGLDISCQKRPVSPDQIEEIIHKVELAVQDMDKREVSSRAIGEEVMKQLQFMDKIAYIRFASVYKEFKDIDDFIEQVEELDKEKEEG